MAAGTLLYLATHGSLRTVGFLSSGIAGIRSPLWALALGMLMIVVAEMQRFEQPGGALANIAVGVFCLVYVGLMSAFVVQIRLYWGVGAWQPGSSR